MLLHLLLFLLLRQGSSRILRVGMFFSSNNSALNPYVGWRKCAAAPMVAWGRIQMEQLMPDITDINFQWNFDECIPSRTTKGVVDFLNAGIDVILGPACSDSAQMGAIISPIFDRPVILWGPTYDATLDDATAYPTVMATSYSAKPQSRALSALFRKYAWTDIAFIYMNERDPAVQRCGRVVSALDGYVESMADINIVYRKSALSNSISTFRGYLREARDVSRVILLCFESATSRRNMMLAVSEEGMATNEFLFFLVENQRTGFQTYFSIDGAIDWMWIDHSAAKDGRDSEALAAARKFIVVGDPLSVDDSILDVQFDHQKGNDSTAFLNDVRSAFAEPPFNCPDCTQLDTAVAKVAELHDALYMYASIRNRTIAANPSNSVNGSVSGRAMLNYAPGSFIGQSGTVNINANASRDPIFFLTILGSGDVPLNGLRVESRGVSNSQDMFEIVTESTFWATRGGVRPANKPKCGFKYDECPLTFEQQYLAFVIAAVVVFVFLVIAVFLIACWVLRSRAREEEAQNRLWQIAFGNLVKPSQKSESASKYSLQSSLTTSTRFTLNSKKETETHAFFLLFNEPVAARKHTTAHYTGKAESLEIRQLRALDHDNINKFIGIVSDSPQFLSVWKYCSRGSLRDVIEKGTLQMDWFFKFSLMRDISEGLYYLHHSSVGAHGWLSSSTCLVDERWQLKISYAGCHFIKYREKKTLKQLLSTAPELIRSGDSTGTKAGDVYSFAIVASEIVSRKSAWEVEDRNIDVDELVYKIKRGGKNPPRPSLDSDDSDANASMLLLIRDCWKEEPEERPTTDQVKALVKSINHGRSANLMDHVFNVLEQYASNLEEDVEARMKELIEEKKKSDILLYRMLPKQVAEKLKLGQSVEPEGFDCVTIFFSDVVSFTTLASRCSPLQVVNLLNDLYSTFDSIIDEHDAYKVETIGDGYLCVSGLPHRNGNEHAREIAEMSFALLAAIKKFRIPHMPSERMQIRIGIHTGGCVAGVVGITMPRYCLFGDSVNTAARMESNGKPGRIHISEETQHFLTNIIGGYRTESRGEVIIKGKGTIETHWLLNSNDPLSD